MTIPWSRIAATASILLIVIGAVTAYLGRQDEVVFGSYGELPSFLIIVTPRSLAGYSMLTLGLCGIAGTAFYQLGSRHQIRS